MSRLLECKVSILKLDVSVKRSLGDCEFDDTGLATDLAVLRAAWDDAHNRYVNGGKLLDSAARVRLRGCHHAVQY